MVLLSTDSASVQWETAWDKSVLLQRQTLSSPITFGPPGPIGEADIAVDDTTVFQTVVGFGATMSKCFWLVDALIHLLTAARVTSGYFFSLIEPIEGKSFPQPFSQIIQANICFSPKIHKTTWL